MSEDKIRIKLQKELLESERKEIRQRRLRKFLIVLLCVMCLLSGTFLGIFISKKTKGVADIVVSESKYDRIATYMNSLWLYGNEVEDLDQIMSDSAYYGMVNFSDDKYTTYFSKEEAKAFSTSINGDYVGVGCQFANYGEFGVVTRIFKDSPCEKAGLQVGDIFFKIDGEEVKGFTSDEIKEKVQGKEGTYVNIEVVRGSETVSLDIQRGKINYTAYAEAYDDYVLLSLLSFGENTAKEIRNYLDDYKDYSKIIIDLRGNGGGYEHSLLEVCGLFLGPDKLVLREIDKDGEEKDCYSQGTAYDNFESIVLITDYTTASAAEVFTVALKELHPNCIHIGDTTYGKGVVQVTLPLGDGSYLKVTKSYWQSPNGNSFNGVGIDPDEFVYQHDLMYEVLTVFEDDMSFKFDDNDHNVKVCQLALDFLDYKVDRIDGYFNSTTELALNEFKSDNNLKVDGILDRQTYLALISKANFERNHNSDKDYQLVKAKEIIESK